MPTSDAEPFSTQALTDSDEMHASELPCLDDISSTVDVESCESSLVPTSLDLKMSHPSSDPGPSNVVAGLRSSDPVVFMIRDSEEFVPFPTAGGPHLASTAPLPSLGPSWIRRTPDLGFLDMNETGPTPRDVEMAQPSTNSTIQAPISAKSTTLNGNEPYSASESAGGLPCPFQDVSCPNQYEALIRPDEHTVVDSGLLLRTPYIINTQYMALICTYCKHSISPNSAWTHAQRFHQHCKVPRSFVTELNKKYPGLTAEKIHPGDVIQPIFGLAVPMEQYVVCARCLRGYLNVASWRCHVCQKPEIDLNGKPPHFLSLVQTFFREPRICLFPIETPIPKTDRDTLDDFALFMSQFHPVENVEDEVVEPVDYRELDQFLSKEGWILHVVGCSRSELSTLPSLPRQDECLAPIMHETFLLMLKIQSVIGSAGFHVRRLLGRRPS
jgi:hypothetical protein